MSESAERFFDIKKFPPKKGQVLARYRAMADLINGFPKDQIVNILRMNPQGAELAVKILIEICGATPVEAARIALEMAKDLQTMTDQEVLEKPYRYLFEQNYWTEKHYIPDDPHWSTINVELCMGENHGPA